MTLVFNRDPPGPATHALLIGVGHYPHLPGGGDPNQFADHEGMGQLSSPPHSVRALAEWLCSHYRNPAKPLGSLELLISDRQPLSFAAPGEPFVAVERATMPTMQHAVKAWKARGDNNPENLLFFFFCGHGIASGLLTALLLEDFGSDTNAPLRSAIDFNGFYLGMDKCAARQQVFFVDACRVASTTLIEAADYKGDPIIYGSVRRLHPGRRSAPIYYSTVAGDRAYGRPGQPSVFAEALIRSFDGAGSDDAEGDWRVETDTLHRGISFLAERMMESAEGLEQVPPVDQLTHFTLHHLENKPIVPVSVGCRPRERNPDAVLTYNDGASETQRPVPEARDWSLDLPEGDYRFVARLPGPPLDERPVSCHVRPPYRRVTIQVNP